jgi:hypothetical protein
MEGLNTNNLGQGLSQYSGTLPAAPAALDLISSVCTGHLSYSQINFGYVTRSVTDIIDTTTDPQGILQYSNAIEDFPNEGLQTAVFTDMVLYGSETKVCC